MAGLNIRTIRTAVKTTIDGASIARDVAVYAYAPGMDPDVVPDYPAILIGHAPGSDYRLTFGPKGLAQLNLELEVRCMSADEISGEMALDDLLSAGTGTTSSLFDGLTTDPTLGGAAGSSKLSGPTPPRPVRPGGPGTAVAYWSSTFTLTVYQARS